MSLRVVLVSLILAASVHASPAPVALAPWTSAEIALKRAHVTITDGVKINYPSPVHGGGTLPRHAVGYAATYVLENPGKEPCTERVGFPTATAILGAGTPEGEILNVKVTVDGELARHDVVMRETRGTVFRAARLPRRTLAVLKRRGVARVLDGDPTLVDLARLGRTARAIAARVRGLRGLTGAQRRRLVKRVTRHHSHPSDLGVASVEERWYTVTLRFKAGQTRKIKLSYQSPRGHAGIVASSSYAFSYAMRTGSRWSGPIGHFRLELVLETPRPLSDYVVRPRGFKRVKPRRLVLERRRFVPRQDLVVRVKARRPR